MSATIPPTPTPPTPTQAAINDAVKAAQNLPDLVAKVQTLDPAFADAITGKALAASKSPWGTLLCSAVAWLAAKYGLTCTAAAAAATSCWSADTVNLVGGLAAMGGAVVGAYIMRAFTRGPITGVVKAAPPATTATLASIGVTVAATSPPPVLVVTGPVMVPGLSPAP